MVTVLIPWRDVGCRHRADALALVEKWYTVGYPDWRVRIGVHPDGGPWSKARAVAAGLTGDTADTLVIADADVLSLKGDGLDSAVLAVEEHGAAWAMPHTMVHRLTQEGTGVLLRRTHPDPFDLPTEERPYRGVQGGGIVVLRRGTYEECPLDPRFEGWGGEDQAWGVALHALYGRAWRGADTLVHLWHPPQARRSRKKGSVENSALYRRYCVARHDPAAMRELIQEAT